MFKDNSWYSHRKILNEYCGHKDQPIYGTIQHGWFKIREQEIKNLKITIFPNCPIFCWNDEIKDKYNKNNIQNIISIGAPFIYLADDFKEKIVVKHNVLVFPPHSDIENNQISGFKDTKKLINEIEEKFEGPYAVCLYYQDNIEQVRKIYSERNWKIYCCGDRQDKDFLNNFIRFVKSSNNIAVYELTSASIYSLYLNVNTFFFKSNKITRDHSGKILDSHDYDIYKNFKMLTDNNLKLEKKINIAKEILGTKNKKSRDELTEILGLNNKFKLFFAKIIRSFKIILKLF